MGLFKKHKTKYALTKIVNNPIYKLDSLYAAQQMDLTPIENKINELQKLLDNSIQTINNNFAEVNKLINNNAGEIDKLKNKELINNLYKITRNFRPGTTVWIVKKMDHGLYAYYLESNYDLTISYYNPFFKKGKEYIIYIYMFAIITEVKNNKDVTVFLENICPLRPVITVCKTNGEITPPKYTLKANEFVIITKQNIFNIADNEPVGFTTRKHTFGFRTFQQVIESKEYEYN